MTRQEFEAKSFEEIMEYLNDELDTITTLDCLKAFVKQKVNSGDYLLVEHIIKALRKENDEYYWWHYDYSMGIFSTPIPIASKENVEMFIDD